MCHREASTLYSEGESLEFEWTKFGVAQIAEQIERRLMVPLLDINRVAALQISCSLVISKFV